MSEHMTLWIVEAYNDDHAALLSVYARDEQHAREQAKVWLEAQKALFPEHRIYHRPDGALPQYSERSDPEW